MATKQNFSGSFVNPIGIASLFVLVLTANYFKQYALSSFLLFICFLFFISYLWGKFAMRRVDIEIEALNYSIFPGDSFPIAFTVSNRKLLPLIWIELLMRIPEKSCVYPEDTFDTSLYSDKKDEKPYRICKRKFTWIMWHQTLNWETTFEARRRGIYFLDQVAVASGDGFGLTIQEKQFKLSNPPAFVVYPNLIPVDTAPFMRNMHNAASGSRGYYEDVTMLKNNREYQTGDSFKKINWRMLARKDEMQVNIYETILPKSSFFIVDIGSYRRIDVKPNTEEEIISAYEEALEDAFSVLGSLIMALSQQEMGCGVSIPDVDEKKGMILAPMQSAQQITTILTALAGVEYNGEETFMDEGEILSGRENWGQMYLLCRSVNSCTCKGLLERMDPHLMTLMVTEKDAEPKVENRVMVLSNIKAGDGK